MTTPIDVSYETAGPDDAAPLVLSNSLGSTTAMWEPQVTALAERLRVVRYDHRGHGGSPVPPAPYELADLGADAVRLLDRLGLERVHWCGLSLGGMVGMWMAINAPERIDRLVLCCTSARLGPPEMWAQRAATVRAEGIEAIADAGLERWLTEDFRAHEPAATAKVRAMLVATPDEGYAACCGAIEHMDLIGELGAIRAPTLVIAGRHDPATPPEHAERIVDGIAGARLELVDAAHLATIEQPRAMGELIAGHLLT
jgi:3-oxoadipate enol-lactonase